MLLQESPPGKLQGYAPPGSLNLKSTRKTSRSMLQNYDTISGKQ
jgi:hypothetical protein